MRRVDSPERQLKSPEKNAVVRLVLWGVWIASGLTVLILLAAIVATLIEKLAYVELSREHLFSPFVPFEAHRFEDDGAIGTASIPHNKKASSFLNDADENPPFSPSDIEQRIDTIESDTSTPYRGLHEEKQEDDEVKDIIKQIYNRKGYSNPTRTLEDDDDEPVKVTRKPRTRRPLKLIGKDFDPNKSFIIKHPNGTLTYVFPKNADSSTSLPTIPAATQSPISTGEKIDKNNPFTQDRSLYPDALINDIITLNKATFEGVFGDDVVIPDGDALNTRSDTFNEPFLCESDQRLIHPVEGLTRNNSNVWIVNTRDYKQGVRIETCRNLGGPCNFCDSDTVCKQVYHYRTLVAVDKITKQPYKEQISLPTCCKCAKILP